MPYFQGHVNIKSRKLKTSLLSKRLDGKCRNHDGFELREPEFFYNALFEIKK
jgi:hypothetical protein